MISEKYVGLETICKSLKQIDKPNLWSYINLQQMCSLIGVDVDLPSLKRRVAEYLAKSAQIDSTVVNDVLSDIERALKKNGYSVRRVKIKALTPVLTGVSDVFGKLLFEIGLHFHPILNVPYIPGSAIKGAVRAGAYELLSKKLGTKCAEERCNRIFGDKDYAGLVGFTDALPVEGGFIGDKKFLLIPDVLTPHYVRASNELEVTPTPLVHVVIAPNTKFQFYVFFKERRKDRVLRIGRRNEAPVEADDRFDVSENPQSDLQFLGLVDQALLYSFYKGVGAKTSIGYSKFEIVEYTVV